jgi:glucose/arabinose dehydrogenase
MRDARELRKVRIERARWVGLALAVIAAIATASALRWRARRPAEGEAIFRTQCALCHSIDARGERGPGLGGVVGRTAGTAPGFAYSRALRDSHLVWTPGALDRFLSGPAALVPGTTMPVAVASAHDRRALVAYLATLPAGAAGGGAPPRGEPHSDEGPFASWRSDAPGRHHRITVADLPAPFATPSVRNGPSVVDPPARARPALPAGFSVSAFAANLDNPRLLRVAPAGDVFVAETSPGRIRVLRGRDGAGIAERVEVYAEGLDHPFGMAFFPPGPDPRWLYVANVNSVIRFPYRNGDLRAAGPAQTILPRLTEHEGGHTTRDIVFSHDGRTMFVSIGSGSNVDEGTPPRSASENEAWDRTHGTGASWGSETNRADVLAFDPEGRDGRVFAAGLRNCVGMTTRGEEDLWCSTNERDGVGDNLVPDYVTRVPAQAFFGWPWYYLGAHEDPRHAGERPDLAGRITLPDVLLQPHSAAMQMVFYEGSMFPPEYRGDAFVAFHGSWNRAARTGPKVVRVTMRNVDDGGAPPGDYEDFMTGFVVDDDRVWARPVGVAVAHDGALLVSEDANGAIWRVAYDAGRRQ